MTQRPSQHQLAVLLGCLNLAALEAAIRDAQPGQPGGTNYDAAGTSGQGPADPTAAAALSTAKAVGHLALFTKKRDEAYACLLELAWLSNLYIPDNARPRSMAKAETPGCVLHQRAGVEAHRPKYRSTNYADVMDKPPFKDPVPVCRWCWDFPRRLHPDGDPIGRLPTPEEILTYERTGKLRLKARPKRKAA